MRSPSSSRRDGRDLLIQGSSTLYPPLLSARLIDRLVLMIFPVLLGDGKSIFDGPPSPAACKLVDSFVSKTGVVIATYEPAGEVKTGTLRNQGAERAGARTPRENGGRHLVTLTLYVHPFSSFSWKALIPLWADGTPFIYRNVDPAEPGAMDELKAHWPLGKFPLLVDGEQVIPEATCIIEHLQAHHPGPECLDPRRRGWRARSPARPDFRPSCPGQHATERQPRHLAGRRGAGRGPRARGAAHRSMTGSRPNLPDAGWAVGATFTLADCAAAPALFYADWIEPIGDGRPRLAAYRARLLAHPAVARAVDEARPYRHYFPLGAPGSRLKAAA